MIEYFEYPEGQTFEDIKSRILKGKNIFFIDGTYDKGDFHEEEKRALVYNKGKILFISSRILFPNGLSMVINPKEIEKDKELKELQLNALDDLKYGKFYLTECNSYKEMLTKIKKIGKTTNNPNLYEFFKKGKVKNPMISYMKMI
jgi:hypothetical protein